MRCDKKNMQELIPLYLEEVLDQPDRKRLEDHLGTCEDCRSEISLLRSLAQEPVPDPGEAFWAAMPSRVARALEERTRAEPRRAWQVWGRTFPSLSRAWATAAVVVLAVLAALLFRSGEMPVTRIAVSPAEDLLAVQDDPSDPLDVASLGSDEIKEVDAWADRLLADMRTEAGAVLENGSVGELYEEIADLDRASLDRLSVMLDAMKKEG